MNANATKTAKKRVNRKETLQVGHGECYIPRFSLKAFLVLEKKKIFSVFIIYGHGGPLV